MGHKHFYFPHFNSKMEKTYDSFMKRKIKGEKTKLHIKSRLQFGDFSIIT